MTAVPVAKLADLAPGTALRVDVDGHRVALIRIDDDVYAIGDRCTHQDISLAEGDVLCDDKAIECWKHGSAFSVETGEPFSLPATKPVPTYRVTVVDGEIQLELS